MIYPTLLLSLLIPSLAENFTPEERGRFSAENDEESEDEPTFTLRWDQIVLINVYESSGLFSIIAAVNFQYVDERLSWNRTDYDNISSIYVRWDALWIPPLTPISCESFSRPQFDDMTHAEVSFDGSVEMSLVWQLSCNCTIVGTYYPFDTQRCYNYFSFLDGSSGKGRIVNLTTLGQSITNDVWTISPITTGVETWQTEEGEETAYFYTVELRRSSTYYLVFTILPTLLQSVVAVLGMLGAGRPVKEDVPIRIALGVGSLTSIMFILASMQGSIPKRDVPVLALFVIIEMIIIVVGIVYLALRPERLFLLCIQKAERRVVMDSARGAGSKQRGVRSTRTRVLLILHDNLHRVFLLLLLTGSACNLGFNVLQYYRNE